MSLRTCMLAFAALFLIAGLSAAVFSMKRGKLDQAIAFSWPAVSVAVMIGVMAPRRREHAVISGDAVRD